MNDLDKDDDALDILFANARATPPDVPDALMARILSDAADVQPEGRKGWRGWWRSLGGAPGLGGLVTATCVGFWLGVAPPAVLPDLSGQLLGQASTLALDAETGRVTDTGTDTGTDIGTETEVAGFGWYFEESDTNG